MNEFAIPKTVAWGLVLLPLFLIPWKPHKSFGAGAIAAGGAISGGVFLLIFARALENMGPVAGTLLALVWFPTPFLFGAGILIFLAAAPANDDADGRGQPSKTLATIGASALIADLYLKASLFSLGAYAVL